MRECGQTSVEWLAVLAGVAALASALAVAAPTVAPAVTGGMRTEICRAAGGSCGGDQPPRPATAAAAPRAATPAPPSTTPDPQQPTAPAPDLCGSSWFNAPELWFTSACAGHDRCYGAHGGKAACDTAFLRDMLAICATVGSSSSSGGVSSGMTRASCRAAAHLYYKAVVIGGGFSYCHRPVCREE
jgi:hypothetical protein